MDRALITFSNGETLEVRDCQKIVGKYKIEQENKIFIGGNKFFDICKHASNGLIPSISDFLVQCDFFHTIDNENKIYSSVAVVSIENL